ncbi:hypothetical protein LEMLEM_LOCUS1167 [Lemmus lemmus]
MAEGPGRGQRGDRAAGGRAMEEEEVVRRRCRRGEEAEVFQPCPEGTRSVAAGTLVEERFRQMHLRKQVSYSLLPQSAEGADKPCGPRLEPPAGLLQPPLTPQSGSAERGRESLGRMSALGAGHSGGGGCDVAAALGPAKVLGTKEAELPGALRQMWRSRSWDVPQIPAEVPQTQ